MKQSSVSERVGALSEQTRARRPSWLTLCLGLALCLSLSSHLVGVLRAPEATGPRVVGFRVQGQATRPTLLVDFDRSMVEGRASSEPLVDGLVSLDPPTALEARFLTPRRLQIRPRRSLPPFAQFKLRFGQAFADPEGRPLNPSGAPGLSFASGAPRLLEPPTTHIDYRKRIVCGIHLNGPVGRAVLEQHLRIEDAEGRPLAFGLRGAKDSWRLLLEKRPPGGAVLILRKGLHTTLGAVRLAEDERHDVSWAATLRVSGVRVRGDFPKREIVLRLSHEPTGKRLAAFVEVDPAPADLRLAAEGASLVLAGSFPPRRRVAVRLRQGLEALHGLRLEEDVLRNVLIPAPTSSVRFLQGGRVLSAAARPELELTGINLSAVEVEIQRVYPSNIVPLALRWEGAANLASEARVRRVSMGGDPDTPWTERLNLETVLGERPRGVYHLTVRDPQNHWTRDRRLLQVTDLAPLVRAGPDGLVVFVTSLSDGAVVADAEVTVFDKKNQVLAKGRTDEDGLFSSHASATGVFVVTARTQDDLAYVDMRTHGLSHRARDIEGRLAARGLEAFVWSDTGVVRPGETCHLGAAVRGPDGKAPPEGLPLALELRAPDGRLLRTYRRRTGAHGMVALDIPFALDAPAGRHTVAVLAPGSKKAIGRRGFRVDTVVPDRIEPFLELPAGPLEAGSKLKIAVGSRTLSGAPTPGLQAKLRVRYASAPGTSPRPGFLFGDTRSAPKPRVETVATVTLGDSGRAEAEVTLPPIGASGLGLRASFELEVVDVSGRAALAREVRGLPVSGPRLGVAAPADTGFELPIVLFDGERAAGEATLERIEWHGAYVQEGGRLIWRSEQTGRVIETLAFECGTDPQKLRLADPGSGSFRATLRAPGCHAAVVTFERWRGQTHTARTDAGAPGLPLRLLGGHATPGQMATLEVDAPFAGHALLTIEGPSVFEARRIELVRGPQRLEILIPDAPAPNLHAALTLTRGVRDIDGGAARLLGAVNIPLRRPERELEVALDLPDEALPGTDLLVGVRTGGPATVRVHLVDEGLLRLTAFKTPGPAAFFHATRRLETRLADVYTGLLERMRFGDEDPDPGGGGLLASRLDPTARKTIETVALASALVSSDGEVSVPFTLPENYEGRLRVFVVAAGEGGTGQASRPLVVRAPVSVFIHTPRAVAPGDEFDVVVQVEGHDVRYDLTLEGLESLSQAGGRYRVRALDRPGVATMAVTARDAAGHVRRRRATLSIRPAAPFTVSHVVGTLAAGETLDGALPGRWLAGHRRARITVGGPSALELLPALERLLEYPYGCVEQTTSRAFPLLAWSELARATSPEGGRPADTVRACIDRLLSMQTSDGGLGYWPGARNSSVFASAYGGHFLIEAARLGRAVPEVPLNALLDFLEARVRRGDGSPYAVRVLATGGRAVSAFLPLYLEQAETAEARAHLAAALLLAGDGQRATDLIATCGDPWAAPRMRGGSLDSPVRAAATLLGALVEVRPEDPRIADLVLRLTSAARAAANHTTQENAAALLALAKYHRMKRAQATAAPGGPLEHAAARGVLTVGERRLAFDERSARSLFVSQGDPWHFRLQASAATTYVIRAEGIPLTPPAGTLERGMQISRHIEGVSGPLRQGRVYRVVIEGILPKGAANILLTDVLPGGLEIEAARDQEGSFFPDRVEPRDDRVLFFRSDSMGGAFRQTYLVRAVTPGVFRQPAVQGELLYAPEIRARASGGGTLEIVR